jgi:hypothetical protein
MPADADAEVLARRAERVTLTLHGPIGELPAALRTLADALDHEQATSTVTYTATAAPQARGFSAGRDDRQPRRPVSWPKLTPAAVEVLVVLCRHAPEVPYEALQADVQAQLGISRARLGGVLTPLAGIHKRLPRDVGLPDRTRQRTCVATGSSRLPPSSSWVRLSALARLDWLPGEARPMLSLACRPDRHGSSGRLKDEAGVDLGA